MTKISESPHPLKKFRLLKKKKKSVAEKKVTVSILENFATNARQKTPYCKLFYCDRHKISYCSEYPNVVPRKAMCRELNFCILCSTARHKSESCQGKFNKLPIQCDQCKAKTCHSLMRADN